MVAEIKESHNEDIKKRIVEEEIKRHSKSAVEEDVPYIVDAVKSRNIEYLVGYSTRGEVAKTAMILALGWRDMDIELKERFLTTALTTRRNLLEARSRLTRTEVKEYHDIQVSLNRLREAFPIATSEDGKMFPQRTDAPIVAPALRRPVGR